MGQYVLYGAAALAAAAVFALFKAPIKWGYKLALNTALGLVLLVIFNLFGRSVGVTLGVNLLNGLIVGLFGPAGLVLLLIIRWLTI